MKRAIALALMLATVPVTVLAANKVGEIAGNYYTTDITAWMNGKMIPSYNIGGRTVIIIEDLADYGFNVNWDANNRTISAATDKKSEAITSSEAKAIIRDGNKDFSNWVKYTSPDIKYTSNNSDRSPAIEYRDFDSEMVFYFNRKIPAQYMNGNYFPVVVDGKVSSEHFIYTFDEANNALRIKIDRNKTALYDSIRTRLAQNPNSFNSTSNVTDKTTGKVIKTVANVETKVYMNSDIKDAAGNSLDTSMYLRLFLVF